MAYKIIWTPKAEKSFGTIVLLLQEQWSEKVVHEFVTRVTEIIDLLRTMPNIGMRVEEKPGMRSVVVSKQTKLFYRVEDESIVLFKFFDTRRHPNRALE